MQNTGFPFCCTGEVIYKFGQSPTNATGHIVPKESELRAEIIEALNTYKAYGYAFICATLNQEQKVARKVLYNMGFKYSGWMSKTKHSETDVRLYWFPLEKWNG